MWSRPLIADQFSIAVFEWWGDDCAVGCHFDLFGLVRFTESTVVDRVVLVRHVDRLASSDAHPVLNVDILAP